MTTITNFTDGEDVDAFMLKTRIMDVLNNLLNLSQAPVSADSAGPVTTTSTTYVDTATVLSVNFTAPPSGIVLIQVAAEIFNNTVNLHSRMAYRLSGATTYNPADATKDTFSAMVFSAPVNAENTSSRWSLRTGLTAGGSYTATAQHRTEGSGATASFRNRTLLVLPWPLG